VSLSGIGSHAVTVSWQASTSTVAGYNVYRGATTGGPYTKLNSSLVAATNYVDSSVQAGQTYYYVATAVDAANNESVHSNQAIAVVPSP
jgi:fibronectin type 3 domain-containing protein